MALPATTYSDSEAAAALRANPGLVHSSDDPTEATAETVRYMCQLVEDSLADGIVQQALGNAQLFVSYMEGNDKARQQACAIWFYAKRTLLFVHHSKLQAAWMPDPTALQLLIRPDALLKMKQPKGDCAVYTTLICAMLQCAGVEWEICTAAVDPKQPGIYSHVYPRAVLSDGRKLVLDASHGKYPGWEVPAEHISAKQIWDADGEPIEDSERGKFNGLHGIPPGGYLYGGNSGMGQATTTSGGSSGAYSVTGTGTGASSGASSPMSDVSDCAYGGTYPNCNPGPTLINSPASPTPAPTTATSIPSTAGTPAAIASDIAAATAGASQVARIVTGNTAPINSSVLLFGGLAVAALLVISMMSGKK